MFKLSTQINSANIVVAKKVLGDRLPNVKSSHRCEAMARAFGYRTYAALLQSARAFSEKIHNVDESLFVDYLGTHGFHVSPISLYAASARMALMNISQKYPTLTVAGFGTGMGGVNQTAMERTKKLADGRAGLTNEYAVEPFLASLVFLSHVERTKTIRSGAGSYGLKHLAEKLDCSYPTGEHLGPVYVPNGVFIAAAIHAGFDAKPHVNMFGEFTLNASFNMSKMSLRNLQREFRS